MCGAYQNKGKTGVKGMEIIYEDSDVIVVNKEAGLPVQAGRASEKDLISELKNHLAKTGEKEPYLGIVHRLDQPVEGLVVFAKNNPSASDLSRQVRAKSAEGSEKSCSDMRKAYQAVVLVPDEKALKLAEYAKTHVVTLQDTLLRRYSDNTTVVVPEGVKGAKDAELTFRTLSIWKEPEGTEKALLEIHLHTGRHHQIRVQMANAGLPLDGDRKYGPSGMKYSYNIRLCAYELRFRHPATGKKMKFQITPSFIRQ